MKTFILFCSILVLLTINPLKADIDSGLVAYYPFNGNANDESGNLNNGVINGAALTQDRFGQSDQAYNFNGIDNYIIVETPSFSFNYNSSFTVSAWVRLDTLTNEREFVWNGTVASGNFVWTLDVYQGYLRFGATRQQSDWYFAKISTDSLNTDIWYNFIGVYDNRDIRLYLNGTEVANNYFGYTNTQQTTLPLSIGGATLSINNIIDHFKGNLDDIRIYNRALSQNEITQLFSLGASNCNLSIIPQGYYNSFVNKLYKTDTIKVLLRQSIIPYSIIDSAYALIDSTNFSGTFNFQNVPTDLYYIVAQHKNCIETWSSIPVNIIRDTIISYKFTTSISQAYADNMIQVDNSPVRYGIFSGDINKNGFIDLDDLIPVNNDASSFLSGENIITDLTGDRIVDLTDVSICYNNASNFVAVIKP